MLKALGDYAQSQNLGLRHCFVWCHAIRKHARQFWHFCQPVAIIFLLMLNGVIHTMSPTELSLPNILLKFGVLRRNLPACRGLVALGAHLCIVVPLLRFQGCAATGVTGTACRKQRTRTVTAAP